MDLKVKTSKAKSVTTIQNKSLTCEPSSVQRIDGRDSRVNVDALDVHVALVRRLVDEDVKNAALKRETTIKITFLN